MANSWAKGQSKMDLLSWLKMEVSRKSYFFLLLFINLIKDVWNSDLRGAVGKSINRVSIIFMKTLSLYL